MRVVVDLKLVRLDDGDLKATMVHEGEGVAHQHYETVEEACADLSRLFALLPTQRWFRELAGE